MAVVADLLPGVDLLTRLAVAGAEVAVVEHQRPQPPGGERLREVIEEHLLDSGEAVGQDDRGNRTGGPVWQVQPAPQGHTLGVELDILSHGTSLPSAGRLQGVADGLHPDEAVAEHEGVDGVLDAVPPPSASHSRNRMSSS